MNNFFLQDLLIIFFNIALYSSLPCMVESEKTFRFDLIAVARNGTYT